MEMVYLDSQGVAMTESLLGSRCSAHGKNS